MQAEGRRLGIDFGSSSTVAVLAQPGGRVAPVLFGETPVLPSAVCADVDGRLLAGRDALYLGRSRPEYLEPNPKRRIDEGNVLLGDREVPVAEIIAAVLRRAGEEAARVAGGEIAETVLTYPAGWGPRRRAVLRGAAELAGFGAVALSAEPVAAASYFVHVLGNDIPAGNCLLVYDFGAGTFDASVVRRTGDGFAVLAEEGLTDAGGLDIDAAIVSYLGAVYAASAPASWARLTQPGNAAELRANRQLWQDVREAKEMLSRTATTSIHLPLFEVDAPLGREQLEQLARPVLDRTVAATRAALHVAGVGPGDLAGVFLVGGSSRIPLAATLLHRALGIAPAAIEQPELVVAGGSLYAPPGADAAVDPAPPTASFSPPVAPPAASFSPPAAAAAPPVAPFSPPVARPAAPFSPPAARPVAPFSPPAVAPFSPPAAPVSAAPGVPVSAVPVSPVAAPVSPAAGIFAAETSGPVPLAPPRAPALIHVDLAPGGPPPPPPSPPRRAVRALVAAAVVVAVLAVVVTVIALRPDGNGGGNAAGAGGGACGKPKIAFMGGVTGPFASLSLPMTQGVRLAVKQYGAAHPGCPVALQVYDTTGTEVGARIGVGKLDSDVLGLVGPPFSGETGMAGPVLEQAGLPFISPGATADGLSTQGWHTFHRAIAPDSATAAAAVKYLSSQGKPSVYVVTMQTTYGQVLRDAIRKAPGVSIVDSAEFSEGDTDFASLAATISGSKAQSVFFAGYPTQGVAFVKALRQAGFSGPVVAGDSVYDPSFATGLGANADKTYVLCGCVPVSDKFREAYSAEYHSDPTPQAAVAYDCANFLLDAIAKGADSRSKVGQYLGSATYQGTVAKYHFTDTGEMSAGSAPIGVYSVSAGAFDFQQSI